MGSGTAGGGTLGLVVVALLVGLGLGLSTGGSLRRLGRLALRDRWLVVAAAAVQVAGAGLAVVVDARWVRWAYVVGLALSAAAAGVFVARNRRLPGMALVAVGLAANALVVVANGAMPVSAAAAERAGVLAPALVGDADPRHATEGPGTRLALLDDRVAVPLPVLPDVLSAGDCLVAAGLGLLVLVCSRREIEGAPCRSGSVP